MKIFKTILMSLLLICLIMPTAYARKFVQINPMVDSSGTALESYSMTNQVKVTTSGIDVEQNTGFNSILVLCSGDVDLSYQISMDNTNWYYPYTTDGSTLTSAATIATAITSNRWIVFPARLAKYIRFFFEPDSASTVSAYLIYQEETGR